jgi:DNA-binding response OmpR family regulator
LESTLNRRVPVRILSLEDNADLQQALVSSLARDGHHVRAVASISAGRSALLQQPFDLLISDGNLGDETSLELLTELKERRTHPKMHVIVLTANLDIADAAKKLGYPVIEKPCGMRVLRKKIAELAASP